MEAFQKEEGESPKKRRMIRSQLENFKPEDIFQKLPIGIAIIDPATGKFIFINSNFAQILGYTEKELLKKTFQSITYPEDLGKNQEAYEKLRKGEVDSYSIEKRNVRKDGSIVWVNLTAIRFKDNNNREFHLGAIFDLSVRKLSEQQLKSSEELLRSVITNAPISIFATDEKGIFTLHEGKAIERVGMKPGDNVGASAYDLFAGLEVIEHNGQVTSGKSILDRVLNGEYLSGITELNGVVFDNQFAPIWDNKGNVKGMLGVATDITEQKRMEKERSEFENRYQMLFNEIDEGFCIIEMIFDENRHPIDYRFLEINPAFEKQTGLENAQGQRMRELKPHHEDHWFEIYGRIALTGTPERFVNRAEQLHRWYDVYAFRFGQPEKHQVAVLFNDITERKRTENELHEREEKWRNLFEILPVGVSIVNNKNHTLEINDALAEILDISKNDIINGAYRNRSYFRPDMTPMPPEEFPSIRALNEKKIIRDVEIGIKKEDGSMIWTNVSAAPISSLQSAVTITTDITGRKKREEEMRYRAEIAANISDGVSLIREKDGIIVHTSRRFEEMFGYAKGELIGKHVSVLNAPVSDRDAIETARFIIESVRKKGKWKGVVENRKKDGSTFWTQASVTQFEHSSFGTVFIAIQMDVTEQIQAETTLRENEIRQRAMISNISDVIAIVDEQGINRFKSANVEKWFGWTPDELVGQKTFDNIHPDDQEKILNVFNTLLAESGKAIQAECRYRCKDNRYKWIELTAVNQIDNPAIDGILVNYHDISQRKKAQEKLARHEKELTLLSAELLIAQEKEKKMLARELHDEIGQALTAMKINLSTVLKNIPAETNTPVCERIKETDELLNSVLTRVHDISLNLRPAILELLGFAATIKSYAQQFEKRTGIKVRITDNCKTNLNTEQEINLFRIVQEALTNVAKHAEAQNIEICFDSGEKWFKLTIADDGKGFVTNPENEISGKAPGIGLIGMHERVSVLQGKIRINSGQQKGTKIKIKVPLHGK